MAQEAYFDSKGELAMPYAVSNIRNGDFLQSSTSSICTKEEGYASPLDFPFSIVKMAQLNANLASGDEDSTLLDKFTDSGSGISINSLVADANLIYSSEAFLQRSGNDGMKYLNIPSSPKSLISGNLSNSPMDVSGATQQNSVADQNSELRLKIPKTGSSAPLSKSKLQNHPFSVPTGMKQDSNSLIPMLKKPRIDANANANIPQDINQSPDHHPQLRSLLQHHGRILDSLPQYCGVQVQQSQQQFRHHLQQQRATCPASPGDDGMCSQRIQQLYSLKNQPQDNSIDFWRKIVSDFYASCAKERWCFSSYKNIGQQAHGILSLGAVGEWCCDLCSSGAGKGFEASFEVLPRLWKIKFESGVLEEILFLGFPQERKLPSGLMLLEYDKAVQQSVYENFRVVHEGKLRVLFRHDFKILSWEFCASHHDEYLLRRSIVPQVNQLMCAAQEYQGMLTEGSSENKVPIEKLLASYDMFANAENQFTTNLELPTVNELGFSKRYVRCMQIAEVLNIMKDLMTFSLSNQKLGPIDSMHAYCHQGSRKECHGRSIKTQGQEKAHERSTQNVLLTNRNSSTGDRSADLELLLANYYQKMLRESLLNSRTFVTKPDQSHLMDPANQRPISSSFQGHRSYPSSGLSNNSVLAGLASSQSSETASKNIQQQMIDKLLQNALENQKEQQIFCDTWENIFSGLPTGARATNRMSNGAALGPESSRVASGSDSVNKAAGSNLGIIPGTGVVEFPAPPEAAVHGMHGQQQFTKNDV